MFASLLICVLSLHRASTLEVGSCTMTMSCNDPSSTLTHGGGSQTPISIGKPGKKGPMGEKGDQGPIGLKGEPAAVCICPEHNMLLSKIESLEENLRRIHSPRGCRDVLPRRQGSRGGVYTLYPGRGEIGRGLDVYCDTETSGGGWIVFQRRMDGSEDFYRDWNDYVKGFGKLDGEFWLGLDNLRYLMEDGKYELRIDLEDFENNTRFALYSTFAIGAKESNFAITSTGYSGDAGNSFQLENVPFSTKDRDHDSLSTGSCANSFKGGWWYTACHSSNLNGLYLAGSHESYADGIEWYHWRQHNYSLKFTEMKMRKLL